MITSDYERLTHGSAPCRSYRTTLATWILAFPRVSLSFAISTLIRSIWFDSLRISRSPHLAKYDRRSFCWIKRQSELPNIDVCVAYYSWATEYKCICIIVDIVGDDRPLIVTPPPHSDMFKMMMMMMMPTKSWSWRVLTSLPCSSTNTYQFINLIVPLDDHIQSIIPVH